jgi:hypothetical protein
MSLYNLYVWFVSREWYELFLLLFSSICDLAILYILYKILKFLEKKGP